ncbi:MAG: N-6 DNA methylase, partial [Ignavibacteria bacterium]|nr:N-6 DNA methylase [Ignavibacteria bacterium]
SELYVPKSQYEFSELSVEILGSAYEQFLGKVIRITPAHHAKIEEKPEVRKAGGVYYTPEYIVEYIVKNTVGKLIEGKTPKEISIIKIVDPACGSGSFLIGAYNYLLNYHKNYYSNNGKPAKGRREDTLTPEGHLTTAEKKRILLNNIYGVDIDVNAVEVTKLSLLLKCLEGETEASIAHQLSMFHERVLPTLENNIKSGNSLVSTDIYENELFEVDKKTKPFNWEKEFPEVFVERIEEHDPKEELKRIARQAKAHAEKALEYSTVLSEKLETVFEPQVNYTTNSKGGFDVVIGNPPYGYQIAEEQQKYFEKLYKHQDYQKDFYLLFLERYEYLLKNKGILGVIISNTWLQSITLKKIRSYLLNTYAWNKVLLLPEKVFNAVVDTHVIVFQKEIPRMNNTFQVEILKDHLIVESHELIQSEITTNGDPINVSVNKRSKDIFEKICGDNKKLYELATVYNGAKPFEKGKGTPPQTQKILDEKPFVVKGSKPDPNWKPLIRGSLINRYV